MLSLKAEITVLGDRFETDSCGCRFVVKSQTYHGIWDDASDFWITQTWTYWVAVRVYECKKGPGLCRCSAYPVYPTTVKIGLVLKKEWEKRR